MKKNLTLVAAAGMVVLALASCSKKDQFVGTWQAMSPVNISAGIPAASDAHSLTSVTFGAQGDVMLSSIINATQPVYENYGALQGYEVSVAATATVKGKWAYVPGEDDDLVLTFDQNSLNVDVDSNGVTFRQNMTDGEQQPVTDSLTAATVAIWKQQFTSAMRNEIMRYSRLDDVKTTKDGQTLKFEIENPEQDLVFRRVE